MKIIAIAGTLALLSASAFAGYGGPCPVEGVGAYRYQPPAQGTGYIRTSDGKWFAEGVDKTWACYTLWRAAGNVPLAWDAP